MAEPMTSLSILSKMVPFKIALGRVPSWHHYRGSVAGEKYEHFRQTIMACNLVWISSKVRRNPPLFKKACVHLQSPFRFGWAIGKTGGGIVAGNCLSLGIVRRTPVRPWCHTTFEESSLFVALYFDRSSPLCLHGSPKRAATKF